MAYTTINKSSDFFNTVLYTGNGANARGITGVGFQPDFVWNKGRDDSWQHILTDIVRGATKNIYSDSNSAEVTDSTRLQSFNSDGFTIGTNNQINNNSDTYVAWNWKAGTGQGSSNTAGSINTTYTSVNTTAGFSISKYTGTGSGATVGHGLGATPDMIFWKRLDNSAGAVNWILQSPLLDNRNKLVLNTTEAKSSNSSFANVDNWSNSVFTLGTYEGQNSSGGTYVAYAFAEKTGYSKFGTYVGNGNVNGTFVYTGFVPAFFMLKRTDGTNSWRIWDNKRDPFNVRDTSINANENGAEYTDASVYMDFLSNGVKFRTTGDNVSGGNYIYMAFAEAPLVGTNGVTAKAR